MDLEDSLKLLTAFGIGILASFGHSFMTGQFVVFWRYLTFDQFMLGAVILITLVQILSCLVVFNVVPLFCDGSASKRSSFIKIACHIGTAFLFNFSMV